MKKEAVYETIKDFVEHPGKNKLRIAHRFSVTLRTVNRWIDGYEERGKSFFVHGNATLEPDCKIAEEIRKKVVELYQGEIYQGANFAHFTEMLDQYENIHISEQSVRNILHAAGIQSPKMWKKTQKRLRQEEKQREKEIALKVSSYATEKVTPTTFPVMEKNSISPEDGHSTHERCKYFGELVQMDASSYAWFGGITTNLHVAIDDCTGRCIGVWFDKEETLFGYYNVLKMILLRYGIPAKFRTDKRTVFEYARKGEPDLEGDTFTQFSYACKQLGIEIETTSVPEVKGRVERLNQTLQSRLPVIFRREGITDIYHLFLGGKTFHEIARILTKDGIKTPMGKDKWKTETVRSILTNEKYMGSARLQKTFVSDFLTKKVVVNNGQRKQWFVKDSHDAIITPEVFELVQQEITRRCGRQGRYYDSPFTGKLKCALCGELYGHRKWHSDRASASEGWICINKYKKGVNCLSGKISEDEIKKAFLLVCNRLFANRTKYGQAYEEEILPRLCDVSEQKQAIADLKKEIEQYMAEAEALIAKNSKKPQSDEGFNERIESFEKLIKEKNQEILKNRCLISERLARKEKIKTFLTHLDETGPGFREFDIPTWHALVDYVEVAPKVLTFRLNDGTEEKVRL